MSEAVRSEIVPGRRAPRWMWIALIVSLGLNLLVAGVVASAAWNLQHRDGFGFHGRLSSFLSTLPAERAETLRGIIDQSRPALRTARQEIRQQRREAARLFAAEPVDRRALAEAGVRLLDTELKLRQGYVQLMTELAESMTAQERRALVEWRERHRRGQSRSADRDSGATDR